MNLKKKLENIIDDYRTVVQVFGENARADDEPGYDGCVLMVREKLQQHITEQLVRATWAHIGGKPNAIDINAKKIPIPIRQSYIDRIKEPAVAAYVRKNISNYVYHLAVDKHVFINKQFVIGIECKSFAENAMLKRILVDFDLLKTQHPNLSCYLFQLESQLGGDYSALTKPTYGSHSTPPFNPTFPATCTSSPCWPASATSTARFTNTSSRSKSNRYKTPSTFWRMTCGGFCRTTRQRTSCPQKTPAKPPAFSPPSPPSSSSSAE